MKSKKAFPPEKVQRMVMGSDQAEPLREEIHGPSSERREPEASRAGEGQTRSLEGQALDGGPRRRHQPYRVLERAPHLETNYPELNFCSGHGLAVKSGCKRKPL